ncbi:hypothetical protein AB1N83_006799 [Pleurotus pulmonarius]|nr:hypothetical protein EYR38_006448 [Pleurotus pulmonarius]
MHTYFLVAAAALLSWGTAVSASAFPTAPPAPAARAAQIGGRGDDFCQGLHDAAGGDHCTPASKVPIPQPSSTFSSDSRPTPTRVPEDSTKIPGGAVKETGEEVEWVMDKKSS